MLPGGARSFLGSQASSLLRFEAMRLSQWRTSGAVQTPSWDRRLPACSGSKRCAYRNGGPLEQSRLLPGIAGLQPAPVRSDALIASRASGAVQTPSWDRGFQPAPVRSDALSMEDLWSSPDFFLGSRLPACSGSKRCAYRIEGLWSSPDSPSWDRGFQPAPVRSEALIAWSLRHLKPLSKL